MTEISEKLEEVNKKRKNTIDNLKAILKKRKEAQDKIEKNLKKTNPELLKKIECINNNKKVPKAEELKKSKGDYDSVSMIQVDSKIPLTKVKSDQGCQDHVRRKEVFKGP